LTVARTALGALAIIFAMDGAVAETVKCTALADSAERLRCYDTLSPPVLTPAAGTAKAAEAGLIGVAKTKLRRLLRNPASARFTTVSIKIAADGSSAVCGMVDSQNDTDGMTGPKPFVYDGRDLYVLISSDGADNGTIHDGRFLTQTFERANDAHSKFCR
jgi:hypothetical protein